MNLSLSLPHFDYGMVFIEPWTSGVWTSFWVVAMGTLVGSACGLIGNFLLLRRMALVGDAISHSILPGLVIVFFVFRSVSTPLMFLGALAAGLVTVALIEGIHRPGRIKADAATCISFTTLFALGVTLLSLMEKNGPVHIDADCVLFGEIAFVPLEPAWVFLGHRIGPPSALRMAVVTLVLVVLLIVFYKELLITSFDETLARSMGYHMGVWHYGLMAALSIVVVSAFESVGAILAVAMLIVPAMFAAQLSQSLPRRLVLTVLHAFASALLGWHLALWLECSAAGAMVVSGAALYLLAWLITQRFPVRTEHPPATAMSSPTA